MRAVNLTDGRWTSLALAAVLLGCGEPPRPDFDLSEAQVVDVRPRLHWEYAHLEGARHIPWDCIYIGLQELGVTEEDPVVLYGENQSLASRAETSLRNMSYQKVLNAGSLEEAAERLGLPVVKPASREPDAVDLAIRNRCDSRVEGLSDL